MIFDVAFNEKNVELQADFKEKDVELQADFGNKVELNHLIVQSMTVEKVYAISKSSEIPPTEWEDKAPTPTADHPFLWVKTKTSYTTVDGTVYNFEDKGIVIGRVGTDGKPGDPGVHVGPDAPPESAKVWIKPDGIPTGTETWTFTLEDGTTVKKTVVVVG